MKINNYNRKRDLFAICTSLVLSVFLTISCNKDEESTPKTEANASLTISLKGEYGKGRATIGQGDDATLKEAENKIYKATVFVFNTNGVLDKKADITSPDKNVKIENLTAGKKNVVVVANVPESINFPESINYNWFNKSENIIDLETQYTIDKGLFMSGQASVELVANQTKETTIPISRLVAKVKLGKVIIEPEAGHDISEFNLEKVLIMNARGSALMGLPATNYTLNYLYGAMPVNGNIEKSYLSETISAADYTGRYFYVLPSDNDDGHTTLITLAATYKGIPTYFPFRINNKTAESEGETTDGKFIERNHIYTINITIKRLGNGSVDPTEPGDPAALVVTVEPQDWETEIIQNVEW